MTAPPVTVEPATTVQDASAAMLDAGVQAALVVDRGRVCGIVTAEDVLHALADGHDAAETLVRVIAQPDPPLVRPEEPLAEAHIRMRAGQRGVAPVAGPKDEPLGVLVDPEAGAP
jgi:CBS domain-containing protein